MRITVLLLSFLSLCLTSNKGLAQWNKPIVTQQGLSSPRTVFMSYSIIENALTKEFANSRNFISLNGKWKSHPFANENDITIAADASKDITLPSSWQSQSIDNCKAAIYRTYIDIPELWLDKDIFMVISKAAASAHLYINRSKVGFNENPEADSQYLISKYLRTGANQIDIVVYETAQGSSIDKDNSSKGILGESFVFAQPKTRIDNFLISSALDSNTYSQGILDISISVSNSYNSDEKLLIGYDVLDAKGNIITYNNREITVKANSIDTVNMSTLLSDVKPWSDITPNLYTIFFRVRREGRYIEFFTFEAGFKSVQIKEKSLLVNGKPLNIKGVKYNIPTTKEGILNESALKKELLELKQKGINTIYTSSLSKELYQMCDKYGIYVCCEINISPQHQELPIANNPAWKSVFISRTEHAYQTLRNFPSVIMWSLGDSDTNGYNFYKTYQYLKAVDNRPVIFSAAKKEYNTDIIVISDNDLPNIKEMQNDFSNRMILIKGVSSIKSAPQSILKK